VTLRRVQCDARHDLLLIARLCEDTHVVHTERNILASALLSQSHWHTVAICHLLSEEDPALFYGSACALVRSAVECYVRATWVKEVASDSQISSRLDAANDDRPWKPDIHAMASQLDATVHAPLMSNLVSSTWNALCSYSHGGLRAAVTQVGEDSLEPTASEDEMKSVVVFANQLQLIVAYTTLLICEKPLRARRAERRIRHRVLEVNKDR